MAEYVEGTLRVFTCRGLTFGALICNDLWATPGCTTAPNPYLAWRLKQMGAQFILHAVNSGSDQRYRPYHESNQELWARALRVPIVCVNAVKGDTPTNVASGLISAEGTRVVTVPTVGEQEFTCELAQLTLSPATAPPSATAPPAAADRSPS